MDALSTTGCTIIGRVDKRDSQYFAKDLRDMVEPKDIMALEPYQMIARMGTEIVRMWSLPPPVQPPDADPSAIVEESRRRYCRPVSEIRRDIARRSRGDRGCFSPLNEVLDREGTQPTDFTYDEL
ncbi:MAG: hypothetical protein HON70_15560 [Lentisphaerae bacterium]|nr:hypothetical protein [Lentisphaerota bacterium]